MSLLLIDCLGRLTISLGEGLDSLLDLTVLALDLKLGKSPENLSEGGIRRHHLIQYLPLIVEYTKAQRAVHLPPAPPDLLSTVLHAVLYSGRLPCVYYIHGFPYPLACSSVRPQEAPTRDQRTRRERKKSTISLTPSLLGYPGWAASLL